MPAPKTAAVAVAPLTTRSGAFLGFTDAFAGMAERVAAARCATRSVLDQGTCAVNRVDPGLRYFYAGVRMLSLLGGGTGTFPARLIEEIQHVLG